MLTKRNSILLFYSLGLTILFTICLLEPNLISRYRTSLGIKQPELKGYYFNLVEFQKRQDKNIPSQSIFFLGDSFIQGLATNAVAQNSVNFGIGGDTTAGLLKRVGLYTSIHNAQFVCIMIGLNDFRYRSHNEIIANIRTVLELLPQNIPIVLNTLFSIDENIVEDKRLSNKKINALNLELLNLQNDFSQLKVIDANTALKKNGQFYSAYYSGDGIHLNKEGYLRWIALLKTNLKH